MCICPCIACMDVMYRGKPCFIIILGFNVYFSVSCVNFLFSIEQHALLLRMPAVMISRFVFHFLSPNELVYNVQVLSYGIIFDNHFLFSETLTTTTTTTTTNSFCTV